MVPSATSHRPNLRRSTITNATPPTRHDPSRRASKKFRATQEEITMSKVIQPRVIQTPDHGPGQSPLETGVARCTIGSRTIGRTIAV
jgi:hypothetical protein